MQHGHWQDQHHAGEQGDGPKVIARLAIAETAERLPSGDSIADGRLEFLPPFAEEVVAGIAPALHVVDASSRGDGIGRGKRTSHQQRGTRYGEFRALSKNSGQSTSESNRMLVMMLRTVTFDVPWR